MCLKPLEVEWGLLRRVKVGGSDKEILSFSESFRHGGGRRRSGGVRCPFRGTRAHTHSARPRRVGHFWSKWLAN